MPFQLYYGVFHKPSSYRRRRTEWRLARETDNGPFKTGYAWMDTDTGKIFGGPYLTEKNSERYGQRAQHKWMVSRLQGIPYRSEAPMEVFKDMEIRMINVTSYTVCIQMTNRDTFNFRKGSWGAFDEGTFKERHEEFSTGVKITSVGDGFIRLSNNKVFRFPFVLRLTNLSLG